MDALRFSILNYVSSEIAWQRKNAHNAYGSCQKAYDMICGVGEKVENLFLWYLYTRRRKKVAHIMNLWIKCILGIKWESEKQTFNPISYFVYEHLRLEFKRRHNFFIKNCT